MKVPSTAVNAVMQSSVEMPAESPIVRGYDFNNGINYSEIMHSFKTTGFQATNLGNAIDVINNMINWRLSNEAINDEDSEDLLEVGLRQNVKCKIYLGYTSNLVSSGLREVFRYLAQHTMVDIIVSTAGGIEEDFIKCLGQTYIGDFNLDGSTLRSQGLNRIGNLIVPNSNYCKFEDWIIPILDKMLLEQKNDGVRWTPSKLIHRLGKEIDHPDSIYYWCYKNNIPVYCPALTDGSLGDMIYFHSFKNPGLVIDIAGDIRSLNDSAVFAKKTVKHHICNANLMRNGADFSVFVNTGQEFDGSDAGARPDEAISWGKIKAGSEAVKVYGDATLLFPLIVAETFAKNQL